MRQKYYLRNEGLLLSKHEPYQWAAGQIFAPGELSYHNGVTYLCKLAHVADSAHEPGIGASWQSAFDLLAVGTPGAPGEPGTPGAPGGTMSWRGAYSAATQYSANDGVIYEGRAFYCLQATVGNPPPAYPATSNSYWSLFAERGAAGSGGAPAVFNVLIYLDSGTIKAVTPNGTVIDNGVAGTDDTDIFDAAVQACPNNGSIGIGPGTYILKANKLFYLSNNSTTNPIYYAFGPAMEGKNCYVVGAGPGVTVLKMANNQHYSGHLAVLILNRTTGDMNNGFTSFTLANLTLDGNRANQEIVSAIDGPGLYLSGSVRTNEKILNVELKDSFGFGAYLGNNGSGPAKGIIISGIYAKNCYKSAICLDTAADVSISNSVIYDGSIGLEVLGNTDYATREYDNISITGVTCKRAGITIWCINGCVVSGCTMDITGAVVHSYGLQVHCSRNIDIVGCRFTANKTSQYVTYIDGGGYIQDGSYDQVKFRDCTFDGFQALKVFGSAVVEAHNCTFHAYTHSGTPGAAILLKEFDETISAVVYLYNCELIAGSPDTYLISGTNGGIVVLIGCYALTPGAFNVNIPVYAWECTGAGLAKWKSRWIAEVGYNSTPAGPSTISMNLDRTAHIAAGMPIKYWTTAGGWGYGVVTSITSNQLVFAGMPMSGNINALFVGTSEMVCSIDYLIPGSYASSANNSLIQTFQKSFSIWQGPPARLVRISHRALSADSGTAPRVTASINGNPVGTDNSNTGLPVSTSWTHTAYGINGSYNSINLGDSIELRTTQGGSGDSTFLTVSLVFVLEK